MPDELSVGELGRTVNALRQEIQVMGQGINSRLDKVVSTEVYALQSAYTDQRINTLGQELQKAKDANDALENAFEQYQRDERDRRERERQSRLYQAVIPIAFGVLTLVVAVWAVVAK